MPSSARKNQSPAWKNPREVFKKNLYKRKSSRQVFENLPSKIDQDVSIGENLPAVSTPKKSKIEGLNPFKVRMMFISVRSLVRDRLLGRNGIFRGYVQDF